MIVLLLFAILINSLYVEAIISVHEESYEYDSLEQLEELNSTEHNELVLHYCSNLKHHMHNHMIEEVVNTLNTLWDLLYPYKMGLRLSRNESRNNAEEKFNQVLEDCGLVTKLRTHLTYVDEKTNQTKPAGTIDVRTINEENANLVIRYRYRKSACNALRYLLLCLEATDFPQLYANQTFIAFAFDIEVRYSRIIQEWIGLLVQDGRIINVQHAAKCLYAKEYGNLKFKGRPFFDYFID